MGEGGIAILLITLLLFVFYIHIYGLPSWITDLFSFSTTTTFEDDIKKKQADADKNLAVAAAANNLDPNLLNALIKKTCAYGTSPCINDDYEIDSTGCCVVKPDKTVPEYLKILHSATMLIKDVSVQMMAQSLIEKGLKTASEYIADKIASKSAATGAEAIAKAAATGEEDIALKIGEEAIAKAALSIGEIAAASAGKALAGLADIIAAPELMYFQMATMLVDMLAPTDYGAYESNKVQINLRNIASVAMEKNNKENGIAYPLLIPVAYIFTSSMPSVSAFLQNEFMDDALTDIGTNNINLFANVLISSFTGVALSDSDSKIFSDTVTKTINKDPAKRDGIIFKYLQANLPDDRKDLIQMFPSQSSETVQGVSLSEKGVIYWNTINRDKWINKSDDAPYVAMWANSYVVLDQNNTGSTNKPNVIEKPLNEYLPLLFPFSTVFQNCEGALTSQTLASSLDILPGDKASVYPYQYGVTFNYNTGVCNMTKNWCTHMGLDFVSSGDTNCKEIPGQAVSEFIFGATITKGLTQITNTLKDSYGRKAGTVPSTCKDTEDKNGALCYPKCKDNYKGIGPVCWETCPSGYRDDGAFCAKPGSYGRGGGHITKSGCEKSSQAKTSGGCDKYGLLYYPKCNAGFHNFGCCVCSPSCPDGMVDIGVSCTKKSYPRGAGNLLSCAPGLTYEAGLCYEACKPGFYGGAATCFPCTGLEVTKDQKDKCKVLAPTTTVK